MKTKLQYEPALLIGVALSVLAGIGQAIDAQQGTPFNVWKFAVALIPLITGLAIKFNVVSRAWLTDIVEAADTAHAVVHEVAGEVGVAPPVH